MAVNLKGQWLVAKALSRKMKVQKFKPLSGKIICCSSSSGLTLSPVIPAYSISKMGVIALAKLLAKTLAPKIAVNSIAPGIHVTGIYLDSEEIAKITIREGNLKIPLERIGTVEDVVNQLLFLASPASDYITGQCFPVDGGLTMR